MHWLKRRRNHIALAVVIVVFALGLHILDAEVATIRAQGHDLKRNDAQTEQAVAALEHVNEVGTHGSCVHRNALRNGLVKNDADAVTRSERSTAATVASPTATPMQKGAARANLADLKQSLTDLRVHIPLEKCP